jgi:hypothetical protein
MTAVEVSFPCSALKPCSTVEAIVELFAFINSQRWPCRTLAGQNPEALVSHRPGYLVNSRFFA